MRIVLKHEKILYVLGNLIHLFFDENVDNEVRAEYQLYINNNEHVIYMIIASMSLELQRQYENIIIMHLKEVFDVISRIERFKTLKKLNDRRFFGEH